MNNCRRGSIQRKSIKLAVSGWLAVVGLAVVAGEAWALPWVEQLQGGSAAIQNSGDTSYRSAREGDVIRLDEAVLPSPRARMVVRCPNNTRRRVIPGRRSGIGIICPDVGVVLRSRDENDLLLLNGGVFPYTVRVVEAQPVLAWPVLVEEGEREREEGRRGQGERDTEEARYVARVYRMVQGEPVEQIWQGEAAGETIDYVGPTLERGETYGLVVEAATGSAAGGVGGEEQTEELCGEGGLEEEGSGVARFRRGVCFRANIQRVTVDEENALTAARMAIESSAADGLEPDVKTLALAHRYADLAVDGEVVNLVEPLVASGAQPAAVYALLAESYLRLGRIEQARAAYGQAEGLAVRSGDYYTRLAANLGLAKVAAWRMQPERAVGHLWAALRDVSYVRDQGQADVIVQWLDKLE